MRIRLFSWENSKIIVITLRTILFFLPTHSCKHCNRNYTNSNYNDRYITRNRNKQRRNDLQIPSSL